MKLLLFFALGASIGSFVGLVADRFPEQSIILPASHCDHCQKRLRVHHLIPILSQVFYRGRCTFCRIKIPWRYAIIEAICGGVFSLWQAGIISFGALWLALLGILLSLFDLKSREYPLVIWLLGSLPLLMVSDFSYHVFIFLGIGLVASALPINIGNGDFFFLASLACILDFRHVLWVITLSSLAGILYILFQKSRQFLLPFIPFLTGSYLFFIIIGQVQ